MEYTVIGNHVNLAQRLQSEAKDSQVFISQRTFSMVKDIFDTERIQDLTLKGIHNPVVTYSVFGIKN